MAIDGRVYTFTVFLVFTIVFEHVLYLCMADNAVTVLLLIIMLPYVLLTHNQTDLDYIVMLHACIFIWYILHDVYLRNRMMTYA